MPNTITKTIDELIQEKEKYENEIGEILDGKDWESQVPITREEQNKRNLFFIKNREFKIQEIEKKLAIIDLLD